MIKRYLVFDIGCIECGEESGVVGTYETHDEAAVAVRESAIYQDQNWSGSHHFEIFDLAGEAKAEESHPEWEACKQ